MLKLKDVVNVKIKNYADFDGFNLTLDEMIEFIDNLTYDDIDLNENNCFEFMDYKEFVNLYIYIDSFDTLVINIDGIFKREDL